MQINSLSENIKQLSGSSHQALEKTIIRQIRKIQAVEDYQHLLIMFYGYYKPLQEKIRYLLVQPSLVHHTRQTTLLETDLRQLNQDVTHLPLCVHLPQVKTPLQALAVLYVLEGSTLGGKYILQMIRKQIHLEPGFAAAFFTGHGDETASSWQQFKNIIDNLVNAGGQDDFLISVNDTFDRFRKWAELNYEYDRQEKL